MVAGDILDVENHGAGMCSAYLVNGTASELRAEVATNAGEDLIANVVAAHAGNLPLARRTIPHEPSSADTPRWLICGAFDDNAPGG
jgi:hypothetical protein